MDNLNLNERDLIGALCAMNLIVICSRVCPIADPADSQIARELPALAGPFEYILQDADSIVLHSIPSESLRDAIDMIDPTGTWYTHEMLRIYFSVQADRAEIYPFSLSDCKSFHHELLIVLEPVLRRLMKTLLLSRIAAIDAGLSQGGAPLRKQLTMLLGRYVSMTPARASFLGGTPESIVQRELAWVSELLARLHPGIETRSAGIQRVLLECDAK
ncbi:MAG: hypothetical protein K8T20_04740 [Planctomycetes bacterium]|nr:hypothetical protein [Planctomycetota bacterium]